jgi:hypothetical protein
MVLDADNVDPDSLSNQERVQRDTIRHHLRNVQQAIVGSTKIDKGTKIGQISNRPLDVADRTRRLQGR